MSDENKEVYRVNSTLTGTSETINLVTGLIDWDVKSLKAILDRCMKFTDLISPNKLYPYQKVIIRRIYRSILINDGAELTALLARQSGKSELSAVTIAALLFLAPMLYKLFPDKFPHFKLGIMIGVFAPTAGQCATTHARVQTVLSNDKTASILTDPELGAKKKYDSGVIEIKGGIKKIGGREEAAWTSFVRFQSAAKQSKIESKSYHLIYIDECQEVDDMKLAKSISPMGAAYNATTVLTGTPGVHICEFYNAIQRNRAYDMHCGTVELKTHFEYDYLTVQRYNPKYKAYIDKAIDRYGLHSDYFQMSYALRWMTEKGMAFTIQDFNDYLSNTQAEFEKTPELGYTYVAGLDLGKDQDPTILTILKVFRANKVSKASKLVVKIVELSHRQWEEQFREIVLWLKIFNCSTVAIDSTGKGDPVADILRRMLYDFSCSVIRVNFSLKTKHILATEFYEDMYKCLIKIPSGTEAKKTREFEKLVSELTTCVKTYTGTYLQIEHPKNITGATDDYVDSLLLGVYAANRSVVSNVKTETRNILFERKNEPYAEKFHRYYNQNRIRLNSLFKRYS